MSMPNRESAMSVLRRLARAAGGGSGQAIHTDVPCVDYDWNAPACFSRPQLDKVDALGAALAKVMSEPLSRHLRRAVKLHATAAALRFGRQVQQELDAGKQFRLTLGAGSQPCGLLIVPSPSALGWVARLLGGADGEPEDKALSDLESGLLADMVAMLVAAASEAMQKAGAKALSQIGEISPAAAPLPEGAGDAEYCCITFQESAEDATPVFRLALVSDVLAPVAQAAATGGAPGGAQAAVQAARASLTDHFGSVPIPLQAVGWDTELTMGDLMNLEVGDVVLLASAAEDPIELRAGGKCVSLGYAVTADGHYAIELSEVFTGRSAVSSRSDRAPAAPAPAPAGKGPAPVQRKGK